MIIEKYFEKISAFAKKSHDDVNCTYGGSSYYTHIEIVEEGIDKYREVFLNQDDYVVSRVASSCHDLIEDARLTYNNVKNKMGKDVANVVLKVTDVPAETRFMRHMLTMPKTVTDYRAILVKMADLRANASFSKANGSSMYKKYKKEYLYRRPIFMEGLKQFDYHLNEKILIEFWDELDIIHDYIK